MKTKEDMYDMYICMYLLKTIWVIPAETAGNGKDNVYNFFFSNVQ